MSISKRWPSSLKASLLVTPLLVMSLAGVRSTSAAPAQQGGPQTFNAVMGHEIFTEAGKKSSWQADRFYSDDITVNAGDTIKWKHDAGIEPHTVTFLAGSKFPDFVSPECNGAPCPPPPPGVPPGGPPPPGVTIKLRINPLIAFAQGGATFDGTAYTSSGIVSADNPGPKDYSLTFTKPGTYTFVCLVHAAQLPDGTLAGMQGKVTVQAAGSARPKTDAQLQAAAQALIASDEQLAKDAEAKAAAQPETTSPGPNGTTVHHVNVSNSLSFPTYALDYMRFGPGDIKVNLGDTVEWSSPTAHTFHNVLLGEEPEAIQVEPQPAGPPKLYFNTDVALPTGDSDYAGSGLYSSGIIVGSEDPPALGVQNYSLTFTAPGRFEYICGLHYHNGMDGHVEVANRTGSVPGMPTTGKGSDILPLLALLAGLLIATTGVGLRLRKVGAR